MRLALRGRALLQLQARFDHVCMSPAARSARTKRVHRHELNDAGNSAGANAHVVRKGCGVSSALPQRRTLRRSGHN